MPGRAHEAWDVARCSLGRSLRPGLRCLHRGHVHVCTDNLHGLPVGHQWPWQLPSVVFNNERFGTADLQDQEMHERLALLPGKADRLAHAERSWLALGHRLAVDAEEVAAPVGDDEGRVPAARGRDVQVCPGDAEAQDGVRQPCLEVLRLVVAPNLCCAVVQGKLAKVRWKRGQILHAVCVDAKEAPGHRRDAAAGSTRAWCS
mmetsp:Transcript_32425/g.87927  ORF Transcript_32425/g.87927 Transcript_32425/m.87927 type:complete len:203 (+) Transcript_32425:1017-1625(+)